LTNLDQKRPDFFCPTQRLGENGRFLRFLAFDKNRPWLIESTNIRAAALGLLNLGFIRFKRMLR
jgi:hypothetical protein